jgi:phosphoribosylglycinamide formyltransferase-1
MYGNRVHQSVKDAGEQITGITIHLVNEYFDEGEIIFQASVDVASQDSVEEIANKVHRLEYTYYPKLINKLLFN